MTNYKQQIIEETNITALAGIVSKEVFDLMIHLVDEIIERDENIFLSWESVEY